MSTDIDELVSICPHCDKGIKPNIIKDFEYANLYNGRQRKMFAIMQCPVCKEYFFVDYLITMAFLDNTEIADHKIFPKRTSIDINFDNRLSNMISPDFCKIYKQALIADSSNLTEITGISFRKAVEVLVKDYAYYLNHDVDKQEILKMSLHQTINKYFKDSEFEPIFKKISWLGNDHSHTFNKHDDYDVEDLKRFITSCISKIISNLDLDELNNIEPKNN